MTVAARDPSEPTCKVWTDSMKEPFALDADLFEKHLCKTEDASFASSEELDGLQQDLDGTSHDLDHLELDFADELDALTRGLQSVFENWRIERTENESLQPELLSSPLRSYQEFILRPEQWETPQKMGGAAISPTGVADFDFEEPGDRSAESPLSGDAQNLPVAVGENFNFAFHRFLDDQWNSISKLFAEFAAKNQRPKPSKKETKSFLVMFWKP